MSERRETRQAPEESSLTLENLLKAPVKLASSSSYRRDRLAAVGFARDNITAVPMPEAEEVAVQARLRDAKLGRGIAAEIARAKVDYLAQHADPGDLVVGMDTLPVFFAAEPKDERLFTPEFLNKPETKEEAAEMMRGVFTSIVDGYRNYLQITRAGEWPDDNFNYEEADGEKVTAQEKHYLLIGNYRSATVRVETGVAMRFPHQKKIETFVSAVTLMPQALYKIAQRTERGEEAREIDQLVAKVLEQVGDTSLKITGGINWADEEVRKILEIKEYLPFSDETQVEKGLYYGAPEKAIQQFLTQKFSTQKK